MLENPDDGMTKGELNIPFRIAMLTLLRIRPRHGGTLLVRGREIFHQR